jgi:hypothetical protein
MNQNPYACLRAVGDIPQLPVNSFAELQAAVRDRRISVGIDSLAAARWSADYGKAINRVVIAGLSLLLIGAAAASVITAVSLGSYWLLAAPAVQAVAFYVSPASFARRRWVTAGAVVSVLVLANLLLNNLTTAATLTAYATLTFGAVRAAGYVTGSGFRKALLADEELFVTAFTSGACSLREKATGQMFVQGETRDE